MNRLTEITKERETFDRLKTNTHAIDAIEASYEVADPEAKIDTLLSVSKILLDQANANLEKELQGTKLDEQTDEDK